MTVSVTFSIIANSDSKTKVTLIKIETRLLDMEETVTKKQFHPEHYNNYVTNFISYYCIISN